MAGAKVSDRRDWVSNPRTYALAWGLPTASLIGGMFVDPSARTLIWTGALLWMGTACLANARRCGRTHCRFTGPFFLIVAVAVWLFGAALGPHAWAWLGVTISVGTAGLWWLTERVWGQFSRSAREDER